MSSGNADEQSRGEVESAQGKQASSESVEEQDLQIREGLYLIMNKKSRTTIDLYRGELFKKLMKANQCDSRPLGESASGTQVKGHERSAKDNIGNQLWIVKRDGVNNTYSLRNFQGGTCLDLFEG